MNGERYKKKERFRQLDASRNPQKMIHNDANRCIDRNNFLCAWQQRESFAK